MERNQAIVSLLMLAIICIIGIPIWWNATKTYRADLPYNEISMLAKLTNFEISSRWNIYVDNEIFDGPMLKGLSEFQSIFKEQLEGKLVSFNTTLSFTGYTASARAKKYIKTFDETEKAVFLVANELYHHNVSSQSEIQEAQNEEYLFYDIYFLNADMYKNKCKVITGKQQIIVLVGSHDMHYLEDCINNFLGNFKNIFYPKFNHKSSNEKLHIQNNHSTSVQTAAGYEICFTLANADPHDMIINWDIEKSVRDQLRPFLDKIKMFGPFIITSQVLNFVDLMTKPKKSNNGYFYSVKQVPLILNPLESRLNTYTSNYPILNFVLYSPPMNLMPLTIKANHASVISFTSPRWGGVVINNLDKRNFSGEPSSHRNTPSRIKLDMKKEMLLFIAQLRVLIGLEGVKNNGLVSSVLYRYGILNWELNYLLLSKTLGNLKKTVSTLSSLAQLLEKIANIVIKDDIKSLIIRAIEEVNNARVFLRQGYLLKAFNASKIAFVNSEKAFFDHSLLALLYFPDDQKYAIYLPLFLPMCVPVFLSSIGAIKYFKQTNKNEKVE